MKLPAINVLRGVAALGVVWFHSRVDLWIGFKAIQSNPSAYSYLDKALSWFSLPVSQFGAMVMLFFVLSGFCIHLPLAGKNRIPSWRAYAVRRFFRIYPPYLAVLFFCFAGSFVFSSGAAGNVYENQVYKVSALMMQNWIFDGRQIAMNPSLWSIPVEAEFYFAYPLLLWIFFRYGYGVSAVLTLVFTALGVVLFLIGYGNSNGNFFKYAVIWNAGAWLAEKYAGRGLPNWSLWHSAAMIIVFAATVFAGFTGMEVFYLHYGWGFCSFLLVWWTLGPGERFFSESACWVRMLAFAGTISYSVYLLHFPLFRLAGAFWIWIFGAKPQSFLIPTFFTLLIIPACWLFYRVIEKPSHEIGRKLGRALERTA